MTEKLPSPTVRIGRMLDSLDERLAELEKPAHDDGPPPLIQTTWEQNRARAIAREQAEEARKASQFCSLDPYVPPAPVTPYQQRTMAVIPGSDS